MSHDIHDIEHVHSKKRTWHRITMDTKSSEISVNIRTKALKKTHQCTESGS